MKILVTGGLGFIGHNVVKQLEDQHEVFIVDNETNYGFIPADELRYLLKERSKRIKTTGFFCDIQNKDVLNTRIKNTQPEVIIHLASFPRQKVVSKNPALAAEVMMVGLTNLLEAAVANGVRRFVYISSSMVYGDFSNDVTEDAECAPAGQYAIFKYAGEKLVQDYAKRTGMEYSIIRPSAVYGELDVEDRVVSKFMLTAMKGGILKVNGPHEILDFSYVEDTANGIVLAATVSQTPDHYGFRNIADSVIYNITRSDQKLYTLLDAAMLAIRVAGKGSLVVAGREEGFPSRGRLSINKAKYDLGYNPKVTVEEGFQKYHTWFQNSEYWSKKIG